MSLRVTTISPAGQGFDLTDRVEGLRYSNISPGGDEVATFLLRTPWIAKNESITKGNLLRITDGLDVLFQGRIEEADRGGDQTETISVTAYGLGVRLKDGTMTEIYRDMDLTHWGAISSAFKLAFPSYLISDPNVVTDSGAPALWTTLAGPGDSVKPWCPAMYDANGIDLGSLYYGWTRHNISNADAVYVWRGLLTGTALQGAPADLTGDLEAAGPGAGTLAVTGAGRKFAFVEWFYDPAAVFSALEYAIVWSLVVYGNHGLTLQGTEPAAGFSADQIIGNVVGRALGITARRIDSHTFIIPQAEFRDPIAHEDIVKKINEFENSDWGTWGPDSPLDNSTNGYFDYTIPDTATQHWIATREQCDDVALHTELANLYNQVQVNYSDSAGSAATETRTTAVEALDTLGLTRTATLAAGTLTQLAAQQLGDTFLALSAGVSPARGSVVLTQPIKHYRRGLLPAHYMRADGSNLRIPDILPSETLFSLDATPDRRTTFPIKRVQVDAGSGAVPQVTVELDQTNDLLTSLQARLAIAADFQGA